jgi:hypothetical protein
MGGVGSGNWYRFDKKTTTDERQSVDMRYLHREGLLKSGRWFSLRWSRASRETGSIGGVVDSSRPAKSVSLLYRHRSGLGAEWEDVQETVPLDWTPCNFGGEALVHLPRHRMWSEGGHPLRTGTLLPVPILKRPFLSEPAGQQDIPGFAPGAEYQGATRRQREHDRAIP